MPARTAQGASSRPAAAILLAFSKREIQDILGFALESRYAVPRPIPAASGREAVEALTAHPEINIVICEYPGIGDTLFRHIISLNRDRSPERQIRCVVCSSSRLEYDEMIQKLNLLGFANWGNPIDSVYACLDPLYSPQAGAPTVALPDSHKELNDADFCQIKTLLLIRAGPLQAGVFIRLSPTKYIRMFQEGDRFEEADYRRFLTEKKIEHLYLRRDECSEFLLKFKSELLKILQSGIETLDVSESLLDSIHETAQELLTKLGPTPEVQDVVKATIQVTIQSMGQSPQLSQVLKRLEMDRDKYISSHSTLLPRIACALATAMEWKSEQTMQKLCLAAFLHDMPLMNHKLAAVQDLTELAQRREEFTEPEYRAYKNHPMVGAEMAKNFHEVPPDVDIIILQHHEKPDGSGFPRGLTFQHISPLAAIFIVAHDLVDALFLGGTPGIVVERFLATASERYAHGTFKKMLAHLGELRL